MADDCFSNIIDVAGIAAYIIWTTKNSQYNNNKLYGRRLFLQQFDRSFVNSYLNQCCHHLCAVQRGVRLAIQSLGLSITHPINATSKGVEDNVVRFVQECVIEKSQCSVQKLPEIGQETETKICLGILLPATAGNP
jgi:hypothetical protein